MTTHAPHPLAQWAPSLACSSRATPSMGSLSGGGGRTHGQPGQTVVQKTKFAPLSSQLPPPPAPPGTSPLAQGCSDCRLRRGKFESRQLRLLRRRRRICRSRHKSGPRLPNCRHGEGLLWREEEAVSVASAKWM